MYNSKVIQYLDGHPLRTFAATVIDGRITASAFLRDTGFEHTALYEDYLKSHFLSRNTTFSVDDGTDRPRASDTSLLVSSFL